MSTVRYWSRLLLVNALLTGALVVIALAGVELYLRATIPSSSNESIFESTLATRRYKVMKSNARIMAWGREFRTNTLGFRDRKSEPPPPKQPSSYRIVVLGDSFTASAGVDFDRIYTSVLERHLDERVPGAEVINLSVGGYNIIQYELVLNEVALGLQPDMVLVAVFPFNDLSNDTYRANFEDATGRSKRGVAPPWYKGLYVYRAFLVRVEARLKAMLVSPDRAPARTAGAHDPRHDAEENLAALRRIVDTLKANNIEAVVAHLPNTDDFAMQEGEFAPFNRLCRDGSWNCVDVRHPFVRAGDRPTALRLNLLDAHPNELYHLRVAEGLRDYLTPLIQAGRSPAGPESQQETR
jgi:lysophospholipase L1-like esterase